MAPVFLRAVSFRSRGVGRMRSVGREVFKLEAAELSRRARLLDENFDRAVELLHRCRGRVVVTGIGKSGLIGQKIAATFSSTGTAAVFLHPSEALHGDLGMVRRGDVVLVLSNSGETDELHDVLKALHPFRLPTVLMTGNPASRLARQAKVVLDIGVRREACPLNLAPTASTTVMGAMGDALAVALLKKKKFTEKDFALFHPAGELGRRLRLRVCEIMRRGKALPKVSAETPLAGVLREMTAKRLGAVCVLKNQGKLFGIIVDGDLRRALLKRRKLDALKASDLATRNPVTIEPHASLAQALQRMEEKTVYQLIVTDAKNRPIGMLHMHDLLGRGAIRVF